MSRRITYTNGAGTSIVMGYDTNYTVEVVDGISTPDADLQTQKAPFQDGDTLLDIRFGGRDIMIKGSIGIPNDLPDIYTARAAMLSVVNKEHGQGTLTFLYEGNTLQIPAIPNPGPKFANKLYVEPFQKFLLHFYCNDPYWRDVNSTTNTFTINLSGFVFPMQFPMESVISSGTPTALITNSGTAPAPVTIVFNGPSKNPKMTNSTTGQYIQINKVLNLGDVVTITTEFGNKTVDINGVNGMGFLASGSRFWSLAVGTNAIVYDDDSTGVQGSATLTYKRRFVGV